jgi:eukaryotic-like serine/threonine-protein kinase
MSAAPRLDPHAFRFGSAAEQPVVGGCRLTGRLASGGMGMVFRGIQESLRRPVAVKILNPSLAEDPVQLGRFEREARATAAIEHANVVRCYAIGEDRGLHYIVYELVPGGDTEMVASRQGGRLDWRQAVTYIRDAACGLEAIHAVGVAHRDIKPSNLLVVETGPDAGRVKLCDFGLAKGGHETSRLTNTGLAIGTPSFMPPEQAQGEVADGRPGDIYSLGASLYFLLTGRLPYDAPTAWAVLTQLIRDPFPDARTEVPDLPAPVETVLRTATARDLGERYRDARHLREDCDDLLADRPPRHAQPAGFGTGLQPALAAGRRILVVDDDPVIGRLYQQRLTRDGMQVDVAHDGESALAAIARTPPDLLVLDLILPGLSGLDVLRTLRARDATSALPVIAFSNTTFDSEVAAAWAGGADRVLAKATTWPRQLAEEARKLLSVATDKVRRPSTRRVSEGSPLVGPLRRDFLSHAETVLGRALAALGPEGTPPAPMLLGFSRMLEPLAAGFGAAGHARAGQVMGAAEALARQLHQQPAAASPTAGTTLRAAAHAALAVAVDDPPVEQGVPTILVVDDDLVIRRTAAGILEKVGLKADVAENGDVGLAMACSVHYRVVVTDLLMSGMNGFSVARKINALPAFRARPAGVLFITGLEDAENFLQAGANAVLAKPFDPLELTTRVLTLLIAKPAAPA